MTRPAITTEIAHIEPDGYEVRFAIHLTLDAIVERNDPPSIFVRSGRLVRIVSDEHGRPRLQALDDATLRVEIDHRVGYRRRVPVKGTDEFKWKPMAAPMHIVQGVRNLGEWPGIPPVEAIVETPTLRADGTILDTPGYDPATRLIYAPAPELTIPAIAAEPGKADIAAAIGLLRDELLGDFPFADDADAANALALLLTPIVRPAVGCVPLALLDAPRAGTGKGLLASVTARIATGRPAGVFAAPDEEREWGKAITAMLDDGATFVLIDEAHELRSAKLAAALTADTHQDRRLGATEMIRVPQRATWAAAGNNVQIGGDLPRRCYRIRLDPQLARPWTRDGFRHADLEGFAAEHRGELLAATLTLARAWHAAGRPAADVPALGGFTTWAQTIGGILAHAGIDGFLGNLADFYAHADDGADQWEAFLGATLDVTAGDTFTAADLAGLAGHRGPIRDTLPDELAAKAPGPSFKIALAKALRSKIDTRHGDNGYRLVQAGTHSRNRTPIWRIEHDEPRGGAGVAGVIYPRSRTRERNAASSGKPENFSHAPGSDTPATPAPPQTEDDQGEAA